MPRGQGALQEPGKSFVCACAAVRVPCARVSRLHAKANGAACVRASASVRYALRASRAHAQSLFLQGAYGTVGGVFLWVPDNNDDDDDDDDDAKAPKTAAQKFMAEREKKHKAEARAKAAEERDKRMAVVEASLAPAASGGGSTATHQGVADVAGVWLLTSLVCGC